MADEQARAARAANGSRRERDRQALIAQGGTPPPARMTKQERADQQAKEEREAEQRRRGAMAWVREQAPELPEHWVGVYAGYALHLKHRTKRRPTVDEITAHLRSLPLYQRAVDDPETGIKSTKEAA